MTAAPQAGRGPRLGDSASLWNFSAAPGWTKEEARTLKLCLMKYGVGNWKDILESGLLPGKTITQCNGQTQRLLGQQSLAAYTGLQRLDLDRIRNENAVKTDVKRKSGLIIRTGDTATAEMKAAWQAEALAKYELGGAQWAEVEAELDRRAGALREGSGADPTVALLDGDCSGLGAGGKAALLGRLRRRLAVLAALLGSVQLQGRGLSAAQAAAALASPGPKRRRPAAPPSKEEAVGDQPPADSSGAPVKAAEAEQGAASAPQKKRVKRAGKQAAQKRRNPEQGEDSDPPAPRAKRRSKKATAAAAEADDGAEEDKGPGLPPAPDAAGPGAQLTAVEVAQAEDLKHLEAMGFERQKALEALEEAGGDVAAATEWLVTHCL